MKTLPATPEGIARAARAVRDGVVVAYPTETVYGLGADPFSDAAVHRLFEVKRRDPGNPVLLIVADLDQLERVVARVSDKARAYAEAFWPGPLSLLLPKAEALADAVTAGRDKVCVRCPASATARSLCEAVGSAVTSTSANRSGEPPARSLADVGLRGVAFGVDGGLLAPSLPSTVFDPDLGQVLREGVISSAQLAAVG